jgi:hypothetical protein
VAEEPVVILTGPRTVGKCTLLAGLSREFGGPQFDLDQPETRAAAAADPGFFVSGPDPVLIDEYLVFASAAGTPQDDHNVRRQFRVITDAAGLGKTWVPRDLPHTFMSLLSAHGVPVEAIALLAALLTDSG